MNSSSDPQHPAVSWVRLLRGIAIAILVLAPYGYLGVLLGVAVHEIAGHGLAASVLGGNFVGFQLDFDGMGYALVWFPENTPTWKHVIMLSAGIAATSILGAILLLAACLNGRRPWVALPLLVVGFAVLMDGVPYVFWNAVHPVPPGDIGRILAMTDSTAARVLLIAIGGISMVALTWFFIAAMFGRIQSWITGGTELVGVFRLLALLIMGAIVGWSMEFDWDQIAPGIDPIPNVTGWILSLLAAASLLWIRPSPFKPQVSGGAMLAAIIGWVLTGVGVLSTVLWLRQGVFWFA